MTMRSAPCLAYLDADNIRRSALGGGTKSLQRCIKKVKLDKKRGEFIQPQTG